MHLNIKRTDILRVLRAYRMNSLFFAIVAAFAVSGFHLKAREPKPETGMGRGYRILFAGDFCLGKSYLERFEANKLDYIIDTQGFDYPFEKISNLVTSADYGIVNLETTFIGSAKSPFEGVKDRIHFDDPVEGPAVLKRYGCKAVNLANNHAFDFGKEGLAETMTVLQESGITWFGAGMNRDQARLPLVKSFPVGKSELEMVILGGYWRTKTYDEKYHFYAGKTTPGVNKFTDEGALEQMKALRAQYPTALLLGYPHFGENYAWKNEKQVAIARALIDGGADLVIGHGAHRLQEFEVYKGKWIFYNLGNYIFITPGKYDATGALPYSFISMMEASPAKNDGISLELKLYPVHCDNRESNFQPTPAGGAEADSIFREIILRSPDGAFLQNVVQRGDDEYGNYFRIDLGIWTKSAGLGYSD